MNILNKIKVLSLVSLFSLTSCATIVHGTKQQMSVTSNPSAADVWVDRQFVGNTPIILSLTRKDDHIITISLEGYKTFETRVTKEISGWFFGNIFLGGIIGIAVDASTGGIYRLTPDQVHAEMRSETIAYSRKGTDSYLAIVLEPKDDWQQIGKLDKK